MQAHGRPAGWQELQAAACLPFSTYYARHHEPTYLFDASPNTIKDYRCSVRYFAAATADPRVDQVTPAHCASFARWLETPDDTPQAQLPLFPDFAPDDDKPKTLSPHTANKHIRNINAIFGKLGPAGPHNRDALGILPRAPWIKPLKAPQPDPREIPDEVIDAIYRATPAARKPDLPGILPEHWWKGLLVMALAEGFRRGALLTIPWSAIDWRKATIRLPAASDKMKRHRAKPLNPTVAQHLLRIRSNRTLIFPWPHGERTLYNEWHRIQTDAGLRSPDHVRLHDFKRACLTIYAETAGPRVVQTMGDHSTLRTADHYVTSHREARQAVEHFPFPPSIAREFDPTG